MSDEIEIGLHAWLAHRERLAAAVTSADRVVAHVESAIAGSRFQRVRASTASRWLTPVAATLAVALLLAAVIGGSLGLRSLRSGPSPARTPNATQRAWVDGPVPSTPPPAGGQLFYLRDPRDANRLIAFDWAGHPVGSLQLPKDDSGFHVPPSFSASPDGQRLVVTAPDGTTLWVLTAQGQRLATLPPALGATSHIRNTYPTHFAGDDSTLCQERFDVSQPAFAVTPRTLYVLRSDGSVLNSFPEAPPGAPADLDWSLSSCNLASDTAVLLGSRSDPPPTPSFTTSTSTSHNGSGGTVSISVGGVGRPNLSWVAMVRTVRLSSGVETYRHVYADRSVYYVRASDDGSWLVEEPEQAATAQIRDLRSGRVVPVPVPGGVVPVGPTLVLADNMLRRGNTDEVTLFDWRRSVAVWHTLLPSVSHGSIYQPGGGNTVLLYNVLLSLCGQSAEDAVMIDQNGVSRPLTRGPCDR